MIAMIAKVEVTKDEQKHQLFVESRLEYLRGEIKAGEISSGEIVELQGLAEYIEPNDVLLRQWAGLPV